MAVRSLARPARRLTAGAVTVAMVVFMGGCGDVPDPPPRPALTDQASAIEEWEFQFNLPEEEWTAPLDEIRRDLDPDVAHPPSVHLAGPPEGWDARVVWSAAPCERAPRVRIGASGGRIDRVVIAAGPDVDSDESLAIACPSSLSPHALDLRTTAAYDDVLILLLWDDDLMADWAFHPDIDPPTDRERDAALALTAPAGWDLRVAWTAGPCQRRPAVSMFGPRRSGEPMVLRHVVVEPGPHIGAGDCSGTVWHALDLVLAADVASGLTVLRDPANG